MSQKKSSVRGGAAALLLPLMLSTSCGSEDGYEDEGDTRELQAPLTSNSFLLQHPLTGSAYVRVATCGFDATTCYTPNWYHTGVDEGGSINTSTPVRAVGFGERSLVVNSSVSDHGMGNAVVVRHLLDDGTELWWSDNHMSMHQTLAARPDGIVAVAPSTKLGQVGGSGYGNSSYWGVHLHAEAKLGNVTGNPCGAGSYWGYTPTTATGFCYKNPDSYVGARRVMMPEFNLSQNGVWGDYDVVYGVANTTIYSRVQLVNGPVTYNKLLVGGRVGFTAAVSDFPSVSNVGGTYTHTASKTLSAGDYTFFAAVQTSDAAWHLGYRTIFTVVPTASDFIRDNDMAAAQFTSGGLGTVRVDGYGYGAYSATGTSNAWAKWFTNNANTYKVYVYVGGGGLGSVRYKIYPTGLGAPIYSDYVNLGSNQYSWVQLKVGAAASWAFTSNGYVGLSADDGNASTIYTFDAVKFIKQ